MRIVVHPMRLVNRYFPWVRFVILGLLACATISFTAWMMPHSGTKEEEVKPVIQITDFSGVRRVRDLEHSKLVALTFDDGPYDVTTTRLLDILKEKDARATFFELGNMILRYPEVSKRVVKEKHELGSHSVAHQNLSTLSGAGVNGDTERMREIFNEVLGFEPKIMRPPYGAVSGAVRETGMPLILWSVDSLDWKSKDTNAIVDEVMGQVFDGAVILMHDIYDTTVDAVAIVIDKLKADGYEFATITEMAKVRNNSELLAGNSYFWFKL